MEAATSYFSVEDFPEDYFKDSSWHFMLTDLYGDPLTCPVEQYPQQLNILRYTYMLYYNIDDNNRKEYYKKDYNITYKDGTKQRVLITTTPIKTPKKLKRIKWLKAVKTIVISTIFKKEDGTWTHVNNTKSEVIDNPDVYLEDLSEEQYWDEMYERDMQEDRIEEQKRLEEMCDEDDYDYD